jgi:hypothetical protein
MVRTALPTRNDVVHIQAPFMGVIRDYAFVTISLENNLPCFPPLLVVMVGLCPIWLGFLRHGISFNRKLMRSIQQLDATAK